ncbi:hypothetical protein P9239_12950 [Caballeronia sp. LZ062]|uniref:hypothetical protein n=1 Tax=unclassified Caballeronia TaxID=2646786 RepID=UPI0028654F24|nr:MULTISPECIES: hypothetical protein [unclassified Caballeronia]MDR5854218.1 hypothetical protein [Caballeronia sp. LZ050]MDR5871251.1 hypothetical protein [Caballeronia sp. LZ062]
MSITLNDLLAWSESLPNRNSDEAKMLDALIEKRQAELRSGIADLIASVSQRENWKLHRCAATARRVEQTSAAHLEAVYEYFLDRNEGRLHFEAPEILADSSVDGQAGPERLLTPALPNGEAVYTSVRLTPGEPIVDLYGRMRNLETRLADTPGIPCGIQGIRIMRMVALMSKARSAQLAHLRLSGLQAVYRHM